MNLRKIAYAIGRIFWKRDRGEIESVSFFLLELLPDDVSPGSKRRVLELLNDAPRAGGSW